MNTHVYIYIYIYNLEYKEALEIVRIQGDWKSMDDLMVIKGVIKHGFGNWEDIVNDDSLWSPNNGNKEFGTAGINPPTEESKIEEGPLLAPLLPQIPSSNIRTTTEGKNIRLPPIPTDLLPPISTIRVQPPSLSPLIRDATSTMPTQQNIINILMYKIEHLQINTLLANNITNRADCFHICKG